MLETLLDLWITNLLLGTFGHVAELVNGELAVGNAAGLVNWKLVVGHVVELVDRDRQLKYLWKKNLLLDTLLDL